MGSKLKLKSAGEASDWGNMSESQSKLNRSSTSACAGGADANGAMPNAKNAATALPAPATLLRRRAPLPG
ncbi:hypothetical protein C5U48_18965 [Mycolicibacter virginiensis]|uniref:Uncharacterized protein n=1 Tax=Mycolicibacter virginiensis TaxID=1795032 RepID=A0A9X7IK26_9MYCO|nr:hypothetical protein C5U48_18965 [Mycolicibacter virginiensis]